MEESTQTLTFYGTRFSAGSFEGRLRAYAEGWAIPYEAMIEGGLLWREVSVTVTARPVVVGELVEYARDIGRHPSGEGTGGPGGPL